MGTCGLDDGEGPVLQLSQATREQLLNQLAVKGELQYRALQLPRLRCRVDAELVEVIVSFCAALPSGGVALSLAHNDLGSGTDCEQRLFDLKLEREQREAEKAYHQKKKSDSSKEKDFSVSAQMRRKAQEGIDAAIARLAAIDEELGNLETRKVETPWFLLLSRLEAQQRPPNALALLDLSNCGLHATGLTRLTEVLLELEQRAEGQRVSYLALDGNDLGDAGMGPLAMLVRLSAALQVLQLRNAGITDQGVSRVLSGLVKNRSLALLDLRNNGLCMPGVSEAAVAGMQRFNPKVEVLLG
eukprot:CAMPEP_0171098654 /NCGR_PEP_ID=MMETSP0766_2-20121228/48974_1 /TAXON_ID=439317 /ORGANISM="Gambierdiscus australes, Strain CAWD 149" /LENGTH=299 /DNA_ID=CAMNT_0011558051 /DNA_START=33 /DNA_END=932 /DNA_ORIENTATION=+